MNAERIPVVVSAAPSPTATIDPAGADVDVSVVIVAYGTGPLLVDAVASVPAGLGNLVGEVIVVDNPHPTAADRSLVELSLWTRGVRIARPAENLGFGGGCNLGARLARGRTLVLLNPDATLSSGCVPRLAQLLDDLTIAIASPVLVDPDGSVQECGQVLFADGTTWPVRQRAADRALVDVDYASAACWVLRRHEFLAAGGFDPAFHPAYFEDVDYVLRARQTGGRCVVDPGVEVIHRQGHGTPDAPPPAHRQRQLLVDRWRETLAAQPAPTAG